jgi:uncharacterized membrane protein
VTGPQALTGIDAMSGKLGLFKKITLASVIALMLLLSYNTLVSPPIGKQPNTTIWIIQLLPLAILVPGLIRGGHRSYALLCFVVMIYFMAAVINAFTPGYTWPPYVEIALVCVIFVASLLYARYVRRTNVAAV